jgi:hydrogenase assembly chaperone HypC/HupF
VCLGVPGLIVETSVVHEVRRGKVDFGGIAKQVCLELVPDAQPGDYVLVHVGFGLTRLDEAEARRVLDMLDAVQIRDELERPPSGRSLSIASARPGDRVLVSGTIGDHGIAIMSVRDGLQFETALENELAAGLRVGVTIDERAIPIRREVAAACEMLGLDPLYVASEGKLIAVGPEEHTERLLEAMRPTRGSPAPLGTDGTTLRARQT